jgi:hypothetical protein
VGTYAETWGKLMNIPPSVPLNWLSRTSWSPMSRKRSIFILDRA